MIKKNVNLNKVSSANNESDLVTKGYLDSRLAEFKTELKTEINLDFQKYIDVVMEDNHHKFGQLIESFKMQYEMFARYTDGNEADKQKINSRLDTLESKVLLA
jgi:hypothetical protein